MKSACLCCLFVSSFGIWDPTSRPLESPLYFNPFSSGRSDGMRTFSVERIREKKVSRVNPSPTGAFSLSSLPCSSFLFSFTLIEVGGKCHGSGCLNAPWREIHLNVPANGGLALMVLTLTLTECSTPL